MRGAFLLALPAIARAATVAQPDASAIQQPRATEAAQPSEFVVVDSVFAAEQHARSGGALAQGAITLQADAAPTVTLIDAAANVSVSDTVNASACLTHDLYAVVINGVALMSEVNFTDHVAPEGGASDRVGLSITLVIMAIFALFLMFAGERWASGSIFMVTATITFLLSLGMFVAIDYAEARETPPNTFVQCAFPFALSVLFALAVGFIVLCLVARNKALVAVLFGFAGGSLIMFFLRDIILSLNPALAHNAVFSYYWVGLLLVSVACAFLSACCFQQHALLLATVALGAYLLAIAFHGLVPILGGPVLPAHVFFEIFFFGAIVGALFQYCVLRKEMKEKPSEDADKGGTYYRTG